MLSEASQPHRDAQSRDPDAVRPTTIARIFQPAIFLLLAALLLATLPAHAQGCTQCLDTTRATPPVVQAAYRHAIYLLGGFGAALFIAGALFLRREP